MKLRIEWHGTYWKTMVGDRCRGASRSLARLMQRVDESIEVGIKYHGDDPATRTETREKIFAFEKHTMVALARRNAAAASFDRTAKDLEAATREAILELDAIGVGIRDSAEILGLSRSAVHRVLTKKGDNLLAALVDVIGLPRDAFAELKPKPERPRPIPPPRGASAATLLAILKQHVQR